MRIFDEKNNLLDAYDETKGYLKPDTLLVCRHAAVDAIAEQGHWETVTEYTNGGKDVAWIVDVPGADAKQAWDEYEQIYRFVAFNEKELARNQIQALKQKLLDTDHHILKIAEGAATFSEMAEVIAQRALWRKQINELEVNYQ